MSRWRLPLLVLVVVAVSAAHYLTPTPLRGYHAFFRWFYYIPILLSAFWYGLFGGAGMALLVTIFYVPHLMIHWHGGAAEQWLDVALYHVIGWVTGLLSDHQKRQGERYKSAAEELDRAYSTLKDQTRLLLETEEQLQRADRLSALGELSAGLAHEVKTPLASIRGAAEILAETKDAAERDEFSELLIREADRLTSVVNRFLAFARPQASVKAACDVNQAAKEVLELVRVECRRRGVRVEGDFVDGRPAAAVDGEVFRQVVLNLVMNAVESMDPGGGDLRVSTDRADGRVELQVADRGRGIPDEVKERVFEPFFTTREKGTGLGLSIVKRILSSQGSTIELLPRKGGGTIARVLLPMGEERDDAG